MIDSVRGFLNTLTEGRIAFSTNVDLAGAQSAPEVPVIETSPEPMTAQSGGLYI